MRTRKISNAFLIVGVYFGYMIWDYFHHQWLEQNVSKNMNWFAFRHYHYGRSFQYSWDLILLTSIFIMLMIIIFSGRNVNKGIVVVFGLLALLVGKFL